LIFLIDFIDIILNIALNVIVIYKIMWTVLRITCTVIGLAILCIFGYLHYDQVVTCNNKYPKTSGIINNISVINTTCFQQTNCNNCNYGGDFPLCFIRIIERKTGYCYVDRTSKCYKKDQTPSWKDEDGHIHKNKYSGNKHNKKPTCEIIEVDCVVATTNVLYTPNGHNEYIVGSEQKECLPYVKNCVNDFHKNKKGDNVTFHYNSHNPSTIYLQNDTPDCINDTIIFMIAMGVILTMVTIPFWVNYVQDILAKRRTKRQKIHKDIEMRNYKGGRGSQQ
jgi:hypothetical protein